MDDSENFYRAIYQGAPIKLKENVVPHLLLGNSEIKDERKLIILDKLNIPDTSELRENFVCTPSTSFEPEQIIGIAPKIQ